MSKIVYKSNGGAAGDGIRTMRITGDGQRIEMLVDNDPSNPRWSELILVADEPKLEPEPKPEPDLQPEPQPEPEPVASLVGQRVTILGA